jgi:hypothetical protein
MADVPVSPADRPKGIKKLVSFAPSWLRFPLAPHSSNSRDERLPRAGGFPPPRTLR